ncbi:MAG: hypothetical protein A3I66_24330 [Burkholderiales bacterium RIFCSPLOWO2_02_FULL_57_36]|nr:MAG: hypothetical protein A3I66_24330 [Burkholderiales bacterium RIFCSPLOWO2_02_FULL_57_36]
MRLITIWVFEQSIASGIAGPIDVFLTANIVWAQRNKQAAPLFSWRLESVDGKPVHTASGLALSPDGPISPARMADAVLLPGMALNSVEVLLQTLDQLRPQLAALREQYQHGAIIAANCSANFLLAEAGLLDGRRATTHWCLSKAFRQRYPKVDLHPDEILTEHDRLLCSGAATAYMDLALRLVEIFAGTQVATETAKLLLIDANRTSQAPFRMAAVQDHFNKETDALVSRATRWLQKNLHKAFSLPDLARHLAVSERTVIRRFNRSLGCSPGVCLQTMRMEFAKRLLETTKLSVESVCDRVGYSDVNFFRRVFKRESGLTPSGYRQQFAQRHATENPA